MKLSIKVNNNDVASYYSVKQVICLENISRGNFEACVKSPFEHINSFKTICHETRHLFDHVGTYYGLMNLSKIYQCFEVFTKEEVFSW